MITLDSYIVELYLFDIPRHAKKDHRSSVTTRSRDDKGHAQGHMTLTYKVTAERLQCGVVFIRHPRPMKPAKQNTIIVLASLESEIILRSRSGWRILTHRVTLENYSVDFRLFEFHRHTYMHITSKILSVAHSGLEIGTVTYVKNCFEKVRDLEIFCDSCWQTYISPPGLSTGCFSWTWSGKTLTRSNLTRPAIADQRSDPIRPDPRPDPSLPPHV